MTAGPYNYSASVRQPLVPQVISKYFIASLLMVSAGVADLAHAQGLFRPLVSSGSRSLILVDDSLWVIDAERLHGWNAGRPDWQDSFDEKTLPFVNSGAWDAENRVFWLWDFSVGSTIKLSEAGEVLAFSPRRSSHVQYQHAGGLHPLEREPIAYGGYGYYRAKDYLLHYSERSDNWEEVPFAGESPRERTGALMISGIDTSKVVVAGGYISEEQSHPPAYNVKALEAWSFDFTSGSWAQLPYDSWLTCPLETTQMQMGDVPVHDGWALLFWPEDCALPFEVEYSVRNAVAMWNPLSGEVRLVGAIEGLPNPYRVAGLFVGEDGVLRVAVNRG